MSLSLYDWQQEYLNNTPRNLVMTADLGSGKSAMAITHYDTHNPNGRLLIVCPASKRDSKDWEREIERFLDYTPDFAVMSYEGMAKHYADYENDPTLTIIADEGHMLAQPTTKRSKAFLRIARGAGQWILLSGTPTPNSWRSAATYAILTGLSRNKTDFWRRFVIEDRSRGFPLILGYREQDTLNEWWKQVSKPLVRPLLPSQSLPVEPAMKPATIRAMKQAIKERVTASGDLLDTPSSLFAHLRQLQVSERMQALHNVLEGTDENVVVWYNFNSERQAILDLLAKNYPDRTVYEQSGHHSNLPDRAEWENVKNSVTLAQYQSASAAIELVYASVNVYFSPSTSYANYEQSKGRTRRNGQTKTVLYYHISVQGSPDKKIWGTLKERRDFNQTLISQWYNELSTGKV